MRLAVLVTIIVLAFLLVAAAVGPYFVPTKTYQGIIEDALADKLHARVVIDSFKLRLIPYPGYTIEGFSLISKDDPFRGMPIVEAKKVIGSLSFAAIFGGDLDTDVEARDVNMHYRSSGDLTNVGMMLGFVSSGKGSAPSEGGLTPNPSIDSMPPAKGVTPEADMPEAPMDTIPSMPAPSIEMPPDGESSRSSESSQSSWRHVLIREAIAGDDSMSTRAVTLKKLDIVRGRIEITEDGEAQSTVIDRVAIAAKNISLDGGFQATVKMTGTVNDKSRAAVSIDGKVVVDAARKEMSFRDARLYFGGTQMIASATVGYGMTPVFIDMHAASPNLSHASFVPLASYFGWKVPDALSWHGTVGMDISYKGTKEVAQLDLQLDATSARVQFGDTFSKEPGFPFKVQSELMVKPSSIALTKGTLSLGGNDLDLTGEAMREGDMMTKLLMRGVGLNLSSMRSLLPWLPDLDSLEEGRVNISLAGSLMGEEGLGMEGRVDAAKLMIAGIALNDVTGSFTREAESIEFAALRGDFAGAKMSGNGSISTGKNRKMEFDIVIGDVDAEGISSLDGIVSGKAAIVAKAVSEGQDRFALLKNFSVVGSIVSSEAKISGLEAAAGAFSTKTWAEVSERAGVELGQTAMDTLEGVKDDVSDLKATFAVKEEGVQADSVTWKSKLYSADLAADVNNAGGFSASGTIALDKSISDKLIGEGGAREKMFDKGGKLVLPVKGAGKLTDPKLAIDSEELVAMIENRMRPKPMVDLVEEDKKEAAAKQDQKKEDKKAVKNAEDEKASEIKALKAPDIEVETEAPKTIIGDKKAEEKQVEKKASAKTVKKKRARPKSSPKRRAPAKKSPQRQLPEQPVEDILKVIIGS